MFFMEALQVLLPVLNCYLCQNVLQRSWNNGDELINWDYWYAVVDLDFKAFRPQKEGNLIFRGRWRLHYCI
ncbi:hypothetical protein BX666DRAFT_1944206 [Dichotomocladium elegans]|nr:hypothetical protein BX666DRAFT_1944206 [Dichotomocladium elegans]